MKSVHFLIITLGAIVWSAAGFVPTRVPLRNDFLSTSTSSHIREFGVHQGKAINRPLSVLKMGMFDQDDDGDLNLSDRFLSCLPYVLPLTDGDQFGRFIFMRIPPLKVLDQILVGPFVQLDHSIPFFGFGLFLALVFLSRDTSLSRGVRFNMQQAILIDIVLIFPDLIGSAMSKNTPLYLVEPATNFIFYCYAAACGYSIVSNLAGKTPR